MAFTCTALMREANSQTLKFRGLNNQGAFLHSLQNGYQYSENSRNLALKLKRKLAFRYTETRMTRLD